MKKTVAVLCIAALLACLLTSCGISTSEDSRVELTKNGKIIEYIAEDFSASYYDFDEFKEFVDEEVESYEASHEGEVDVRKEKMKRNTAYLTIRYSESETYGLFNGVDCFSGSTDEALEEGYDLSMDFILTSDPQDGDDAGMFGQITVSGSTAIAEESLNVFIVGTGTSVTVPGTVRYFCASEGDAYLESSDTVGVTFGEDASSACNVIYVLYE